MIKTIKILFIALLMGLGQAQGQQLSKLQDDMALVQNELETIYERYRFGHSGYQTKNTPTEEELSLLKNKLLYLRESVEDFLRKNLPLLTSSTTNLFLYEDSNTILLDYLKLYLLAVEKWSALAPNQLEEINNNMSLKMPIKGEELASYREIVVIDSKVWDREIGLDFRPSWFNFTKEKIVTVTISQHTIKKLTQEKGHYLQMALAKEGVKEEVKEEVIEIPRWWRPHPPPFTPPPFYSENLEELLLEVIKRYLIESLQENLDRTKFILGIRKISDEEKEVIVRQNLLLRIADNKPLALLLIVEGTKLPQGTNTNDDFIKNLVDSKEATMAKEILGYPRPFLGMDEEQLQQAFCEILKRIRSYDRLSSFSEEENTRACEEELPKTNFKALVEEIEQELTPSSILNALNEKVTKVKSIYAEEKNDDFVKQELDVQALMRYTTDRKITGNYNSEDQAFLNFLESIPFYLAKYFKEQFMVESDTNETGIRKRLEEKIEYCDALWSNSYSAQYLSCINHIVLYANSSIERRKALAQIMEEGREDEDRQTWRWPWNLVQITQDRREDEERSGVIDDFATISQQGEFVPNYNIAGSIQRSTGLKYNNGSIQFDLDRDEQFEIFKNYSFYQRVTELPILGLEIGHTRLTPQHLRKRIGGNPYTLSRRKIKRLLNNSCSPFDSMPQQKEHCKEIIWQYFPLMNSQNIDYYLPDLSLDREKLVQALEIATIIAEYGRGPKQTLFEALTTDDEEANKGYLQLALWQEKQELEDKINAIEKWDSLNDAQAVAKHSLLHQLLSEHELLSSTYLAWAEKVEKKFPYRHKYREGESQGTYLYDMDLTKAEIATTAVTRRTVSLGFSGLLTLHLGGIIISNVFRAHRFASVFHWLYQGLTRKGIQNFSHVAVAMIATEVGIYGNHTLSRYPEEYQLLKYLSMDETDTIDPVSIKDLALMEEDLALRQKKYRISLIFESIFFTQFVAYIPPVTKGAQKGILYVQSSFHNRRQNNITKALDRLGINPSRWSWDANFLNEALRNRLLEAGDHQQAIKAHQYLLKRIRRVEETWTKYAVQNSSHFRRLNLEVGMEGWRTFLQQNYDPKRVADDLVYESINVLDDLLRRKIYFNEALTIDEYALFYQLFVAPKLPPVDAGNAHYVAVEVKNAASYLKGTPSKTFKVRVATEYDNAPTDIFYRRFISVAFDHHPEEVKWSYQILGVKKGVSKRELISAYRRLSRRYHPDHNPGDKVAEEIMKHINNSYKILMEHLGFN